MSNTTPKRYELLKDLPDYKVGEIFVWNDTIDMYVQERFNERISEDMDPGLSYAYCCNIIETNPTWFKKLPPKKQRIEVELFDNVIDMNFTYIRSTQPIPTDKFPLIKSAIERCLNDDGFVWTDGLVKEYGREFANKFPQESSTNLGCVKREYFFQNFKESKSKP